MKEEEKELIEQKKKHETLIERLLMKLENLKKTEKQATYTLWIEKSIGIISRYDYYDFFNRILEVLLDKMYGEALLDHKTLEHYVYTIVFEIACPSKGDKIGATFEGNRFCLPDITELPYVNNTHFDMLLRKIDSEKDIVRIFTSLLLEERVLLIMDKAEELLPMAYALQSLIYPFELAILVPYLANDTGED